MNDTIEIPRINKHDCTACALKHLATASTIMIEMLNGYSNGEYEMYLLGNLNEAQEQIAGFNVYISNEIRNLRIDIFDITFTLNIHHLAKCKALYENIKSLKNHSIKVEFSAEKISMIKKPCGCGGNK